MYSASNSDGDLPAFDQCPVLAAMRTQSFDQLMARGTKAYEDEDPSVFCIIISQLRNGNSPQPVEHSLARTIYFREGYKHALAYRLRDMTRFQKEHVVGVLGGAEFSSTVTEATDFQLDVKLQFLVNRHHKAEYEQSSIENDHDQSGSESETESDSSPPAQVIRDDNPVKGRDGYYIKTWIPALGRSVKMRY